MILYEVFLSLGTQYLILLLFLIFNGNLRFLHIKHMKSPSKIFIPGNFCVKVFPQNQNAKYEVALQPKICSYFRNREIEG